MKILLRNSPGAPWRKLEPFEFGGPDGEKKLENLLVLLGHKRTI
jgi:hypothetical protein